ncbi:MAG: hypothetical protein JWM07_724, partial [Candidatus Saccharibacteria bacterium]|nr:hypothetical protein [Candidatus Saccharibacteria bacterium]
NSRQPYPAASRIFATTAARALIDCLASLEIRRAIISNANGKQKAERQTAALTDVQNIIPNTSANIVISLDDTIVTLIRVGAIELPSISHLIIYLHLSFAPDKLDVLTAISMALVVK